jgi:hypothetical protein
LGSKLAEPEFVYAQTFEGQSEEVALLQLAKD